MTSKLNTRQLITSVANDNPLVSILQFIRDDPEGFSISDISAHGMMNYILHAKSADGKQSVVFKYGETKARLDPDFETPLDRQVTEYDALKLLHSILPGSAPKPYCLDRTHNVIAMEDMSSWELLGSQLQAGRVDLEAATSLGRLLAKMHVSTSKEHVTPQRWEELMARYNGEEIKEMSCEFRYERCYDDTTPEVIIPESALPAFRGFVKEIHDMGIPQKQTEKTKVSDCFIHADCHWKSVFVKDSQTALFDFEYSFLGAAAQNVAMPITAYLFCYNNEDSTPTPEKLKFQTDSVQAVRNLLNAYIESHPDLCDEESQAAFLPDVALFLGGCLVEVGIFGVIDEVFSHTDANRIFLFTHAFLVMKSHQDMNTVDKFVNTLFQI